MKNSAIKGPESHEERLRYCYFDPDTLRAQSAGSVEIEQSLVVSFVSWFPGLLMNLQEVLNQPDRGRIKPVLHQVKGTIGIVCTVAFFEQVTLLYEELDAVNERAVWLNSQLILVKCQVLLDEVRRFQNENGYSQNEK
ncbi:MAG: hypothetical protein K1X47_11680 [Cyclobacteriaceae bacterium]|nr:hypothetical protein [Cyclobacteriaceae bacterium]